MALERRLFERKRTVLIEESMDRLEFLVEERSMAEVLKVLLPRILPASWVLDENYFIRPHEGKSDLKRSIPKKLKGFAQHKEQTTGFIIIYEGENETYIEASVENSSSILYDKEIRNKPRTRRTKRNV